MIIQESHQLYLRKEELEIEDRSVGFGRASTSVSSVLELNKEEEEEVS